MNGQQLPAAASPGRQPPTQTNLASSSPSPNQQQAPVSSTSKQTTTQLPIISDNRQQQQQQSSFLSSSTAAAAPVSADITIRQQTDNNINQATATINGEQNGDTTNSNNGQEPVKQFSDKTLQQLAQDYLNHPPADIPDTGFVVAGIAGRFPNADNMVELWDNLLHGHDMVLGPDDKRWPLGLWDLPKKAARIKDISRFDNEFFGYPKDTADYTDHQLRNLFEVVYESLIDAGINPASARGDKRTGIFFGFHTSEVDNEFFEKPQFRNTGYQSQLLTSIADYFDVRGIVSSYDAACASSFAAFHQAVQNLTAGLIDTAIVCGVNISVRPGTSYQFLLLQMLSPTGSSKFLDASADGYAKTEACVSVVLRREDLARRSYASIVHTKCNNDGFKVEGITFPSSNVQEALMQGAIVEAGVDPNQIVYVEAHGTGTPAGDPEEARAIAKVYCGKTRTQPLLIGSVKSNMGHAEGVSGLCSLAKVICTFENELLPKNLHYNKPNPNIEPLVEGRLKPVDQNVPFKHNLIPMNCYGFGGVNVHGIFKSTAKPLDEKTAYDIAPEYPRLITMFGRSQQAIEYAFAEFKKKPQTNFDSDDPYAAYENKRLLTRDYIALIDSINDGPIDRLMNYRGYLLLDNDLNEIDSSIAELNAPGPSKREELYAKLLKDDKIISEKMSKELSEVERKYTHYQDFERDIWFLLPGLGSQWKAMAKKLVGFKPIWSRIESLAEILRPLNVDLIDILTNDSPQAAAGFFSGPNSNVNLFVSIVAVEIAIIDLLKLLNVKPHGIIGHSIGEISCAYADGLLNANETIQLAFYLAKPIDEAKLHNGAMLAVSLGTKQATQQIESFEKKYHNDQKSSIEIACVNGDESVTLSGSAVDIDLISEFFVEENVYARRVPDVKTAFHNTSLRKIENELLASVQKLFNNNNVTNKQYQAKKWRSTSQVKSNNDETSTDEGEKAATKSKLETENSSDLNKNKFEINAQYYVDNLCSPVLFKQVTESIEAERSIIIEAGPHRLFQPILKQKYLTKLSYVSLMKRGDGSVNSLLASLGQLYQLGQPLSIGALYPEVEFPVCKGTGSVSSILKWNHAQQFHVAKYPEAFRKPPCEARIKFDLIDESDKYLSGHCIDGRILFPATGYLYLVWRSFSLTRDKAGSSALMTNRSESQLIPVEFTNVRLYRATILGSAPVELMVRLEEATGQFEVREGGSVVADGYISVPVYKPDGLQFESLRDIASKSKKELTLKPDDVYKQFRVNGYDYGDSFKNIVAASEDGLHLQVKWAGQFIPFSDSVLQSLFLAISKRTSALFLPTKFEYMRINPHILQKKVDEAAARNEPCILDAYCELETGIIVTDGMEMRGVGASPAPRRAQQDPLMETYEFVANEEIEINDIPAKPTNDKITLYSQMCASAAAKILTNLSDESNIDKLEAVGAELEGRVDDETLIKYLDEQDASQDHVILKVLDNILASQEEPPEPEVTRGGLEDDDTNADASEQADCEKKTDNSTGEESSNDDQKKPSQPEQPQRKRLPNPKLKPLDELQRDFEKTVRAKFEELSNKIGTDVMTSSFTAERYLRPLLEIVLENTQSQNVKMLELNTGAAIRYEPLNRLLGEIAPNVTLNYFLGVDNSTNSPNAVPSNMIPTDAKLYKWSPASKALARELQDLDFILYADSSCYPTKEGQFDLVEVARDENGQEIEGAAEVKLSENIETVFASIVDALRPNGFAMTQLRTSLSSTERFLFKLNDYELGKQTEERLATILAAAKTQPLLKLVAQKSDIFGNHVLLFRKLDDTLKLSDVRAIKVSHDKPGEWLELVKRLIADSRQAPSNSGANESEQETDATPAPRAVWLIATDDPQNGAMGMTNCIRREPGCDKVRLLLDQRGQNSPFAYKTKKIEFEKIIKQEKPEEKPKDGEQKPVEKEGETASGSAAETPKEPEKPQVVEIISSEALVDLDDPNISPELLEIIKTDLAYNCYDTKGKFGSFRHFTVSDVLDSRKVVSDIAYVNVATRGDLSSFKWYEAPYKYLPKQDQDSLVSVYYSSLNFRDIMLASGRLPLDALPLSVALSDCILGLEYSGRTREGVRYAGMMGGRGICFKTVENDLGTMKFRLPDTMSLEEGATVPVVYATALMALVFRGKMQKGESVLIHSGSGGVGQAAIRLCLYYGLKVYTTVGAKEKRDFLKEEFPELTDADIFNSRDCTFETAILRATNGRGVDLVLNSLSEDKLQASVRCLADGGRFLEIGKYDMALNNPVELASLDTNKTFHGILLDKLFDTDKNLDHEGFNRQRTDLIKIIEKGLFEGWIKPIKRTVFDKTQVEEAFRYMATGKHIGKVLIKMRDEEVDENLKSNDGKQLYSDCKPSTVSIEVIPRVCFNPASSYIVTGGLGGFGLELSKWMVANGCRNIVLTSRSGVTTGYHQLVIDRLKENECNVLVSTVDNSTDEGAEELVKQAMSMAPLAGIFNLAMVLRDSLLDNSTVEDFETVCKPKVKGVAALDRVTREMLGKKLDLFVVFSSVSCGKGNPGQANYGYANSVMERIVELRRTDGLHGLAIQWGAIGDVGVAFENLGGNEAVIGGTIPQRLPSCFATLSKFLTGPFTTCLSILQADRRSFSAGKKGDLVKTILHVLGIKDPSTVDPNCTLGELGLDSLMAVEIRQALEREYEIVLTVQEIRALTINRIREIGDGEAKGSKSSDSSEPQSSMVTATDEIGLTAAQRENIYQTDTQVTLSTQVPGVSTENNASGKRSFVVDKALAARAPTVLPTDDLILLNGDSLTMLQGAPIFFLAPIQGDFARLSVVSKKLTRPCIGINWTANMAHFADTSAVAAEHVAVIRKYYPQLKILDLVGYSFGAAMAFEVAMHVQINGDKMSPPMRVGKLVLLDGSPAQINIGVRYITNTLNTSDENIRVSELMAAYLMQHSRFDYNALKVQIMQQPTNEQKLKFTSELLAKSLGLKEAEQVKQLADAEEAFCRRFQMMLNYKQNQNKLDNDITLIRATEVYVSAADEVVVDEDYGLQKIVTGRVNSCVIKGNHESFLDDNVDQIGTLLQDVICPVLD